MRHPDGRGTTVPVDQGRGVAKGTLRGILSDVGMTIEELPAIGAGGAGRQVKAGHVRAYLIPRWGNRCQRVATPGLSVA